MSTNRGIFEVINDVDRDSQDELVREDLSQTNYQNQLNHLRNYLSLNHATELAQILGDASASGRIRSLIKTFIEQHAIVGGSYENLVTRLYDDLAGFAFIDKYLYDAEIEEINGNAWNDIEIVWADRWEKIADQFLNAQHAIQIIKKMMRLGGVTLDEKQPFGDSFISTGMRISAMIPPVIDQELGAVFSIRKQKQKKLTMQQLTANGTCIAEEFEFIQMCLSHGVSVGIAGATSSGKTTDIIAHLASLPNDKRIYIIEDTRETYITKYSEDGRAINRVIYTKTRPSDDDDRSVEATDLLRTALRYHPDIIVPAEMRDQAAMTAVEAGRTGHAILGGLHANSAQEAYDRILTMCLMSDTSLSEELLMRLIISAFPIMLFKAQLPDKSRKYMQIFEAQSYNPRTNELRGTVIFQYIVQDNQVSETGKIIKVVGEHRRMGWISDHLADHLLTYGCGLALVSKYASPEWQERRRI